MRVAGIEKVTRAGLAIALAGGRKYDLTVYDAPGSPQEAQAANPAPSRPGRGLHAARRLGQWLDAAGPSRHRPRESPVHRIDLVQHQPDEAVLALPVPHRRQR